MSEKYPGGVIRSTPVTPAGPYQDSAASGIWTLDQATNFIKQGNWPTAGNVNPSAFIENLFSTWLYTGTGATQTITNGIDLAGKGGLVWFKNRPQATMHALFDTARGVTAQLASDDTSGNITRSNSLSSFNSTGFTVGLDSVGITNASTVTYASWTFRKQPKFFDVVTYTGDGTAGRTVAHSLGSVPGCIIVKQTSASGQGWAVYHRSEGQGRALLLNDTAASFLASGYWNSTAPTSTVFSLGSSATVNGNGATYVAYLFAHDAGGFGLTGTDNVISCGSYTGNGSSTGPTVTLGYEPQWLMIKPASQAGNWFMFNNMQGMPVGGDDNYLFANTSGSENTFDWVAPTATGFYPTQGNTINANGQTYIYIAIRRGPMKTPTTGTSVFKAFLRTGTGASATVSGVGFSPDWLWARPVASSSYDNLVTDKLRGTTVQLQTYSSGAEYINNTRVTGWTNDGFTLGPEAQYNANGLSIINWCIGRAPGFFDVVCYSGTSGTRTVTHNLGVVPELMIFKSRTISAGWAVYVASLGNNKGIELNTTGASYTTSDWNNTTPTSTVFTLAAGGGSTNDSGVNYVAYLFASCPGVSKVGSYTGTGALQTIDCGFTGGARWVMIKRTDSTGGWFVYDSARGISSGNDPYLLMNSTAAEVTNTNYVDTTSVGFQVTAAAPAGLNANGGSYIFLAIA